MIALRMRNLAGLLRSGSITPLEAADLVDIESSRLRLEERKDSLDADELDTMLTPEQAGKILAAARREEEIEARERMVN